MYGEAQKYQKESVGFLCKLQVLLQLDESFAESTLKLSSRISHSTYHPMASNDRHNLFLMALNFQKILPKMSFLASTSTTIELYQSLAEKCNLVGIRLSTCGELMCRKSSKLRTMDSFSRGLLHQEELRDTQEIRCGLFYKGWEVSGPNSNWLDPRDRNAKEHQIV